MARYLLLREDDEGLALVRDLMEDHTISHSDLVTWSLFSRLRNNGKLDEFLRGPERETGETVMDVDQFKRVVNLAGDYHDEGHSVCRC
jgi:hypothetical protein